MSSKIIRLSVSSFALPAPRRGSIDVHSGFGRTQDLGMDIHRAVQTQRKKDHETYDSEVDISHTFESGEYAFQVHGRMDGIFRTPSMKIEEIKSSFAVHDLFRRLQENRLDHPYCLQLRTYGYFHWLRTKELPDLSFHLVSSRDGESLELQIQLDVKAYEDWLDLRLAELVLDARLAEKRAKRRKKAAQNISFPFQTPRSGQIQLIQSLEEGMREGRPMMIQAPTGLGKTVGVLFPTLREALSRGHRTLYVTPKNSQHSVAEDAMVRLQNTGASIKSMTLTAKSKMCFKNEPLCNPEYCEFAKDHHTKVAENGLVQRLAKKKSLTSRIFKNIAEEAQVCPFELQLDVAHEADAIICDYNYVFAPRSALGRIYDLELGQEGKPNLIIDEAHNLPSRAMDYYSPSLSVSSLRNMQTEAKKLSKRHRRDVLDLLNSCIDTVEKCAPKSGKTPCKITPPVTDFLSQDQELRSFLSEYLRSGVDIERGDVVLKLCFYWGDFTSALEFIQSGRKEFFTTFSANPAQIKITCCDASDMLEETYKSYAQVIAFSATLKPFEFYSRLSGLPSTNLMMAEMPTPFLASQRKILIIPQVSTKYSERERNYPRIAEAVSKIASLKRGNYFVFLPSFDFLNRVADCFVPPEGFEMFRQYSGMNRYAIDEVMGNLQESRSSYIVFAVQGGVFSEGVDYPGDMAIGAFVVGPPLPTFDIVREEMRKYYEEHYGAGFDYAYAFPAMAKSVQAAGRVIRSETDRGIIVLMDDRFIQPSYAKSMPSDWFKQNPSELVSKNILSDIRNFWHQGDNT